MIGVATRARGNCHRAVWIALWLVAGCHSREEPAGVEGNTERGKLLLEQYACGQCHLIPGVRRAQGMTGPALLNFSRQVYIAGELPNRPSILVRWIQQPSALVPDTLMPDQRVPDAHARDMAAYLMSLP